MNKRVVFALAGLLVLSCPKAFCQASYWSGPSFQQIQVTETDGGNTEQGLSNNNVYESQSYTGTGNQSVTFGLKVVYTWTNGYVPPTQAPWVIPLQMNTEFSGNTAGTGVASVTLDGITYNSAAVYEEENESPVHNADGTWTLTSGYITMQSTAQADQYSPIQTTLSVNVSQAPYLYVGR